MLEKGLRLRHNARLGFIQIVVDVAQSVESRIVIPVVVGSSPIIHPINRSAIQVVDKCEAPKDNAAFFGGIAQLGERLHGMQEVIGSIPFTSTNLGPHRLEA